MRNLGRSSGSDRLVARDAEDTLATVDHASTDTTGLGPWRANTPPAGFVPFPDAALAGSVVDRWLAMSHRFPDRVALRSSDRAWTYAELRSEVLGRADALGSQVSGAEPQRVAILGSHDGDLVVAILTVIGAGHVVVVLDPESPDDQLLSVLAEARPTHLVHGEGHGDRAAALASSSGGGVRVLALADLDGDPTAALPVRGPRDAVMLAFTSGTTGSSKGAIITNAVLLNLVRGATNALGIGPEDRMPMLFPVSMAVAAYPMFLPLLNGGALSTLDVRGVGLAPVGPFLVDERITVAYLSPTVVRFLEDSLAGLSFPDLRLVAMGGELVDADVVELAARVFGSDLLANGYGTTETGVVTLHVIDPAERPSGAVPVGRAVPEVEVLVLGDDGAELPTGDVGEVVVCSPHLFEGYFGHPEMSRQVLDDDPTGRPGWRRYRTGDHGSLDASGALTVTGRLDAKVKVRGRFVVLGDVEASIRTLPDISDAAVVASTSGGITELIAYVVAADGTELRITDLRAALLESTDAFKVPARWVVLDELPVLPNGKTDRRALPAPEVVCGVTSGPVPPATASEHEETRRQVRDLWELLLPVGVIGPDEDFFHLGGDSLLAAQMLVMVEQQFRVQIPMAEMIQARTVRQMAEVLIRLRRDPGQARSVVRCVQAGDESTRPRLWFVHDLSGSSFRVRHLARELGPDQPVWSFESPLILGDPPAFTSLDTFAANYLTHLRRAQPEGPYWLAGYSFGGICAYEMARQLRQDGEEVAFLGVVDVGPGYRGPGWHTRRSPMRPWFGVAPPPPEGAALREQLTYYEEMARASKAGAARHLMVRTGVARVVDPLRFREDLRRRGNVRPEWRLWYAWEQHWKLAATSWNRAHTYGGHLDLFWADQSASTDSSMGWGPLVAGLDIHRIPGQHERLLDEQGATGLARSLRATLDRSIAQQASA